MQNNSKSKVDNVSAENGRKMRRSQWHKPVIMRIDMKRTMAGTGSVPDSFALHTTGG